LRCSGFGYLIIENSTIEGEKIQPRLEYQAKSIPPVASEPRWP
jgi:hypothetical protein